MNYNNLNTYLPKRVAELNMSYEQFATACGITRANIYYYLKDIHRPNGEKFAPIATVKGNGTTSETNHYDYLDRKVATGRTYYRLRQVDLDGNYQYSNVISVDFEGSFTYSVYPNPVSGDELNFEIQGVHETNAVSISLFDELGRSVLSVQAEVDEASGSVDGHLPIDKLANGIYYFRVIGSNIFSKIVVRK